MNMLERFRAAQQIPVRRLRALEARGAMPLPLSAPRPSFCAALAAKGKGAVIAEYKRASPSRGVINLKAKPEDIAALYAASGAAAISVLTEQEHFQGSLAYLTVMARANLPLLRKDFLIDPLQVAETAATPASALLLIARMLDDAGFDAMVHAAHAFSLEAVIEIFDQADLDRVRASAGRTGIAPALIQVNTRDLDTMTMNEDALAQLIGQKQSGETWIAASGVMSRRHVEDRVRLGYDAVLVGTGLMEKDDPGRALSLLTGQMPDQATDEMTGKGA